LKRDGIDERNIFDAPIPQDQNMNKNLPKIPEKNVQEQAMEIQKLLSGHFFNLPKTEEQKISTLLNDHFFKIQ